MEEEEIFLRVQHLLSDERSRKHSRFALKAIFFRNPSHVIAQSFKHNQTWLGRQVCHPGLSWVTNLSPSSKKQGDWIISYLCYFLLAFWSHWNSQLGDKFVSLVWAGRQACWPSHIWLCLKDWATINYETPLLRENSLHATSECVKIVLLHTSANISKRRGTPFLNLCVKK
jgi:hypothetical protein